ncbi:MAG: GlsB/YeaQ/YmgE family stress response membrane protein [Acidobacteriota bacterium]|nr:GlsB/YeaQ/YmgE family stress response membrane protein [Acidobacteriota bacterium]
MLWWLLVGLIAGWATGKIMKGSGYGFIADIGLGILGAFVGGFVMRFLGFGGSGGMIYTILVAIGGAVLVVYIFRIVKRKG